MKRLVYSFIFASLVGMSSCNDFDVPVTDRLTEEDVWKDETLVTGALANLYDKLQVEQNSAYFEGWDVWNVSLTTASDEVHGEIPGHAGPDGDEAVAPHPEVPVGQPHRQPRQVLRDRLQTV